MHFPRILLIMVVLALTACDRPQATKISKYTLGVVGYGDNEQSLKQYAEFQTYIGTRLNSLIELEPAFNEVKALEQISNNQWDLVFAPPGLAAIAISQHDYKASVPLEGQDKTRSIIVAKNNLPFQKLQDLKGKTIALGQKGSATGYYLPIYNLYGINFQEVQYAPTPQDILQRIEDNQVTVGALSLGDYNRLKQDYAPNTFKVVYLDQHDVPSGTILISDRLERNQQEQIIIALLETPSFIASSAGYLPNEPVTNYDYLITVIKRVQEILSKSPTALQK